jgi:hypothetical protein
LYRREKGLVPLTSYKEKGSGFGKRLEISLDRSIFPLRFVQRPSGSFFCGLDLAEGQIIKRALIAINDDRFPRTIYSWENPMNPIHMVIKKTIENWFVALY